MGFTQTKVSKNHSYCQVSNCSILRERGEKEKPPMQGSVNLFFFFRRLLCCVPFGFIMFLNTSIQQDNNSQHLIGLKQISNNCTVCWPQKFSETFSVVVFLASRAHWIPNPRATVPVSIMLDGSRYLFTWGIISHGLKVMLQTPKGFFASVSPHLLHSPTALGTLNLRFYLLFNNSNESKVFLHYVVT